MTDTGKRKEIIKSWLGDNDLVFCSILQTRFPRHCFLYYNMTDSPPPHLPLAPRGHSLSVIRGTMHMIHIVNTCCL